MCKFTPLGFETIDELTPRKLDEYPCKFTPLGFETHRYAAVPKMPRRVNLPRWGLKLLPTGLDAHSTKRCKFTPLGFETKDISLLLPESLV